MKLLVVLGSVREGRAGEKVAAWFKPIVEKHAEVDWADLREINLPMEMEQTIPSATENGAYQSPQTKEWSQRVQSADAVVFVHPEYNHSVNAALKNAIDHIYHEWKAKPIGLVGYGANGGNDAAKQIEFIGNFVKWDVAEPRVAIKQIWAAFDEDGNLQNAEEHQENAEKMLETLKVKIS